MDSKKATIFYFQMINGWLVGAFEGDMPEAGATDSKEIKSVTGGKSAKAAKKRADELADELRADGWDVSVVKG